MQQRVRVESDVRAIAIDADRGAFESMRTLAPPGGRGWEYLGSGTRGGTGTRELAELPDLLVQKVPAPWVEPGPYTLVIDPTNLWLTIHESVGHATELDRALGYEANYAGTSFATPDRLGTLQYGSPLMNVVADRLVPHGLVDGRLGRRGGRCGDLGPDQGRDPRRLPARPGHGRRERAGPLQRLRVRRLRHPHRDPAHAQRVAAADPGGPDLAGLVAGVEDGILVVGDNSWSIDMQRFNFQFTAQRFFRIRAGRLDGQLKDVVYQATTTDFWGSMVATGGEQTYLMGGAFNCGKGQPGQVAAVSHGTPAAVFEGVNVLNSMREAGG